MKMTNNETNVKDAKDVAQIKDAIAGLLAAIPQGETFMALKEHAALEELAGSANAILDRIVNDYIVKGLRELKLADEMRNDLIMSAADANKYFIEGNLAYNSDCAATAQHTAKVLCRLGIDASVHAVSDKRDNEFIRIPSVTIDAREIKSVYSVFETE